MMNVFHLSILAADEPFFEGDCESLVVPTTQGQYGILAMHSNMIAAIIPGMVSFTLPGGEQKIAAVSEGLVKIEDNSVLLLVESTEWPEEIDENRARESALQAKEAIIRKNSIQDYHLAQAKMARAINRLRVKKYSEEIK